MSRDRQGWGRHSPLRSLTGTCEELGVSNTLKVEPERLIERQGKLVRRVVAFPINLDIRFEMKLLDSRTELSPRTVAPRGHPE
jgi:hypothetical protein